MKRIFTNTKFLLALIIASAIFLRFYQIANTPPALTWDEVAWGYNSYSLGLDGRDEFGVFLPYKYLESFGDFKPPLYAYVGIIPIKIWGFTEFATRLPSAFFGVLTVILTFFLTREIFYSSSRKDYYSLFSSFLLAVSPWHLSLSRAAFEANVSQFFIVAGIYFYLMALRRNAWVLILSAISFALSFYTFNTARVFVPIIVITLSLIFIKKLWVIKKQTIVAGIIGFSLLLPIIGFLFSPQASLRFREVNIFSDPEIVELSNQEIANDNNSLLSNILHNRRLKYGISFISHYFDHFNPDFLFISGDSNPKFSSQDVGQLYIWSIPFLVIGTLVLFRKREGRWFVVPLWLLLGIIPAATARETPHALRIETTLPMFQILVGYGAITALFYFRKKFNPIIFKSIFGIILVVLFLNIGYYLYGYYVHYNREHSDHWQYGYGEAFEYAIAHENEYDAVYVTDKLGRPYIYYLMHAEIPPEEFQKDSTVERDPLGFVNIRRVGKYYFRDYLDIDEEGKNILYVGVPLDVPDDATILTTAYNLDGTPSLIVYTK